MADLRNVTAQCDTIMGNTGFDCFNNFGMPRWFGFVNKNFRLTTASIAAAKTALEAAILANNKRDRLYPLGDIVNLANNDEDSVTQTFNTGAVTKVRDGNYSTEVQWVEGGFCVLYAFLLANGKNLPFFIATDKGYLIGTTVGATAGQMAPIRPNMVDPKKFTWSDGTNIAAYKLTLNYEPTQINRNVAFLDFSNDGGLGYFEGLSGLQNVALAQGAARASNVVTIKAMTSCGSVDMYDDYADALADVAAWAVTRTSTGNVITITGVAKNTNVGGWDITVNASDPDYSATAGQLTISLVGPTALAALTSPVVGYESNTIAQ